MSSVSRVAIVTGGGTGIGEAIARRLAAGGSAVAVVGRRGELLDHVVAEIDASGGSGMSVPADLADPSTAQTIVRHVVDRWGRLDVLVNNAGYIKNSRIEDITPEVLDLHYAVNMRAAVLLIQAALPELRRSPHAAVVNISSSSGSLSIPGQSMYGMTKAAVEYMTRSYASELASNGIRVNCLAPGPVDTPIHLTWARSLEEAHKALKGAVPLGRIAQPDEIAKWVEYLVQADEAFITGAVIPVDGGQTLNGASSAIGAASGG